MSIFSKGLGMLVILALFAVPAMAQEPPPQQQEAPPPVEVDLSEEEKEAVARAFVEVEQIQAEYTERFADIQDEQEAQRLNEEFHQEVNEAIEEEGITLELYDQTMQAAQTDTELREELLAMIDEIREEEGYETPQY